MTKPSNPVARKQAYWQGTITSNDNHKVRCPDGEVLLPMHRIRLSATAPATDQHQRPAGGSSQHLPSAVH
jgi:hypothetical protein